MNKLALKIGIGLVLLFGLGVSTGVVVARQLHWKARRAVDCKTYEERWFAARIEEYKTHLNLTPEQITAIRPHFDKLTADMREFRADLRTKIAGAFKEMNTGIAGELTPAQREKFWQLLKEKSEKTQRNRTAQSEQ